ncbi:hypothetical protein Tco_1370013 [Tanacetum coccineum]
MDPYNHTTNTSTKLPILDTGKFKQWKFRIQQYLQHEHYALWEVIEFGDSYKVPPEEPGKAVVGEASAKKKGRTVAITTEDMQKRRNDSYMDNEDENHALVADDVVPTEFALMAMSSSSSSSDNEVYDDSYRSKSCRKNTENLNTKINKLNEELSDCETDLYNYKRGLSQVETRLVEFKVNETKFCERIRVMERDVEIRDNKIESLKNELEELKKEK